MELRLATAEDVAFLTDVVIEAARDQGREPPGFDEATFRRRFQAETHARIAGDTRSLDTFVIEIDGERVGRLRVTKDPDRIMLNGIQLLPRAQSRGIGTAIIRGLMKEAGRHRPLELGVEIDNPRARALYERLGFKRVALEGSEVMMRWTPDS